MLLIRLIARSHVIAVVQRRNPGVLSMLTQRANKFFKGCFQESWRLDIQDVVMLQWKLLDGQGDSVNQAELDRTFSPGKTVTAFVNATWYKDCRLRLENSSGASFAATRYLPSNLEAAAIGNSFLAFFQLKNKELQLTADHAFEHISQRQNIESALRKQIDAGGGLPFAIVSIDCGPSNIDCATEQHCDPTTGKWYCGPAKPK